MNPKLLVPVVVLMVPGFVFGFYVMPAFVKGSYSRNQEQNKRGNEEDKED
jgi:hypothetical protein